MTRRNLISGAAATAAAFSASAAHATAGTEPPPRRALMKAGTQHGNSDEILRVLAAFGVNHICGTLPSREMDEHWSVASLRRLRERVESFGIRLEMLPLPLSSAYITKSEFPHIMLGKSPE